jgi:hydrogenase-4 component B
LNGFVSEWLVYLGLFDAVSAKGLNSHGQTSFAAIVAVVALGLTGALALACFVKVCGIVFLGRPRSQCAEKFHECGWRMRLPMLLLGVICVAIGLVPIIFWPALAAASAAWQPEFANPELSAPLVTLGLFNLVLVILATLVAFILWRRVRQNGISRAGTWNCGYAFPTPRMQYTAGSFAGIITGWFAWILRPRRHAHLPQAIFPQQADFEERTPETVLESVVEPAGSLIMRVSLGVRQLQYGRVQSYLFYLLLGLAALAILAVMGGTN